jgi:dihydrofolate reductase
MLPTAPHLTLIVAATPKNGIGKNGALPWPMLKKEMAYFARVTKRVPKTSTSSSASPSTSDSTPRRQNAVLMGRKTYLSIPPKFRPLKDRTNIVISSQPRSALPEISDEEDVVVSSSILAGLRDLEARVREGKVPEVGRVFVIGGARAYGDALGLECARSVLLTRLREEFECDTFFPELEGKGWVKRERGELEAFVGEEVAEGGLVEEGVGYEFQLWERE